MRFCHLLTGAALLAATACARADEYIYSYVVNGGSVSFTVISPTLATTDALVSTTTCLFVMYSCDQVNIQPTTRGFQFFVAGAFIGSVSDSVYPPDFFHVGTHSADGDTLTNF